MIIRNLKGHGHISDDYRETHKKETHKKIVIGKRRIFYSIEKRPKRDLREAQNQTSEP